MLHYQDLQLTNTLIFINKYSLYIYLYNIYLIIWIMRLSQFIKTSTTFQMYRKYLNLLKMQVLQQQGMILKHFLDKRVAIQQTKITKKVFFSEK